MKPVITEAGLIWGRDAIFLDKHLIEGNNLILEGDLVKDLCSEFKGIDNLCHYLPYKINFKNVIFFEIYPEDGYKGNSKSSFDLIKKEKIFEEFPELEKAEPLAQLTDNHKLYKFNTYDEIFLIVATDFNLEINKKIMNPVITEAGLIVHHEAVYLEKNYFINETTLKLEGFLDKEFCLEFKKNEKLPYNVPFSITFKNVAYSKEIPEEENNRKFATSFDMVENDKIFEELPHLDKNIYSSKIGNEHKLFILMTYYMTLEVVATDFIFEIKD
jgi:hypothetical protein